MSKLFTNNISKKDYSGLKPVLGLDCLMLDLLPLAGQQKSFYGKAHVVYNDIDKTATLYSYNTAILRYSYDRKEYRKLWYGWSATTAQHVKAFCGRYISKAEWQGLSIGLPVFTQGELEDSRGLIEARRAL